MAKRWVAFLLCSLIWACAPKPAPLTEPVAAAPASQDRVLGRLIAMKKYTTVQHMTDSLLTSKDQAMREIATYWKSIAWLYMDRPEPAVALLEDFQGKWTGGLRRVHSEVLLRLAKEASEARLAAKQSLEEAQAKPAGTQPLLDRVEVLQNEKIALHAEIERLENECTKYQKLLKDLEKVR